MAPPSDDPFDEVFSLEERFYDEGYRQGSADGAQAGKVEGRALGLEKGFEKFLESGRLYGRALVWANRLPGAAAAATQPPELGGSRRRRRGPSSLPALPAGARLERNVATLHALVEPETLSTENDDEAVNDFDDRVKRAQGKARVIERSVGEEAAAAHRAPDGRAAAAAEGARSPRSPPPAPPAAF